MIPNRKMIGSRDEIINRIAQNLLAIRLNHPLRVGIDGVDTSGKTSLADELERALHKNNRQIIRASIDHFHQPRAIRYRLGDDSPEGYYRDSFDLHALRRDLLDPLGPFGNHQIITARFDFKNEISLMAEPVSTSSDAILLFDGIFLHRPELLDAWDFSIFVHITFDTVLARAIERDQNIFGSAQDVILRYQTRYIPAQKSYMAACLPQEKANMVLINDDLAHPELLISLK
jgi:uridine kinase